jgi:hypothetical protein
MYVSGSSIEKSYNTLKPLDLNGDNKVTGQEIQLANLLNKIKDNPSPENIKQANELIGKIANGDGDKYQLKQKLVLTVMSAKCSDPPKASELNDILKIMPGKDKTEWADAISGITPETKEMDAKVNADGVMEFESQDQVGNYVKFDSKKGEFSALPDKTIPSLKPKYEQLNTDVLNLAKDVLDGNAEIKGVDQDVTSQFLGKQKDSTAVNTYKADDFDPNKFVTFDLKIRKHTINYKDQVLTIERSSGMSTTSNYTDPATGKSKAISPADLRNKINENYPGFQKFAEENHLFNEKGEFDSSKLSTVKKFVDTLPDTDKKMNFVSNFMAAYYVHSGEGADQKNVDEDNFTEILSSPQMLRADDGRTIIDCQYFAAISQSLLGVSKGNNGSLEAKDVVLDTHELKDGKKHDGLHEITILKDSANGKFYVQSNDQIKEITKDQLKKSGWDEKKGPPTDAQLVKAANYSPPKNKPGEKGLLAEQFSHGTEFNNYSLRDDPLNNSQIPKGQTLVANLDEGGVKTKDNKGSNYFLTGDGKKLPEKAGTTKLPDGTTGEVTITGAGKNYFVGKIKEKNGQEHDLKISWDKDGKVQVDKS